MSKFTIGSQWKTRDGGRVVILDTFPDGDLKVWFGGRDSTMIIRPDGTLNKIATDQRDIVAPWPDEPVEHTLYLDVYTYVTDNIIRAHGYDTKEECLWYKSTNTIAQIKIIVPEGAEL